MRPLFAGRRLPGRRRRPPTLSAGEGEPPGCLRAPDAGIGADSAASWAWGPGRPGPSRSRPARRARRPSAIPGPPRIGSAAGRPPRRARYPAQAAAERPRPARGGSPRLVTEPPSAPAAAHRLPAPVPHRDRGTAAAGRPSKIPSVAARARRAVCVRRCRKSSAAGPGRWSDSPGRRSEPGARRGSLRIKTGRLAQCGVRRRGGGVGGGGERRCHGRQNRRLGPTR